MQRKEPRDDEYPGLVTAAQEILRILKRLEYGSSEEEEGEEGEEEEADIQDDAMEDSGAMGASISPADRGHNDQNSIVPISRLALTPRLVEGSVQLPPLLLSPMQMGNLAMPPTLRAAASNAPPAITPTPEQTVEELIYRILHSPCFSHQPEDSGSVGISEGVMRQR